MRKPNHGENHIEPEPIISTFFADAKVDSVELVELDESNENLPGYRVRMTTRQRWDNKQDRFVVSGATAQVFRRRGEVSKLVTTFDGTSQNEVFEQAQQFIASQIGVKTG